MATSVYEKVEVTLLDDSTVILKPLKISLLREFMKHFEKINDVAADNDASMTVLLECVAIAMKQYKPELSDVEALEEAIDMPTVYKVIEVASGIKLNDPNLLAAAALVGQN